jgi:hypothetical protein
MALDQRVQDEAGDAYAVRRSRIAQDFADQLQAVVREGHNQPITVGRFRELAIANMRLRNAAAVEEVIAACRRDRPKPSDHLAADMTEAWSAITTADPQSVAAEVRQRSAGLANPGNVWESVRQRALQEQAQGRAEAVIAFRAYASEIELAARERREEAVRGVIRWVGTELWKYVGGVAALLWLGRQLVTLWPSIDAHFMRH